MSSLDHPDDVQNALPHQVGDCPRCGGLFELPSQAEPFDAVRCPTCASRLAISELTLRSLPLAEAVLNLPEAPKPTGSIAEATAPEEQPREASDPGHESLDDWLRRTTGATLKNPSQPEPTEPTPPVEAPKKASLSETLGWSPEPLVPREPTHEAASDPVSGEPVSASAMESRSTAHEESVAEATHPEAPVKPDFAFDLDPGGDALKEDTAGSEDELLSQDTSKDLEPAHMGTPWEGTHEPSQSRSWLGPLSAVAGLLVVGGASYYVLADPSWVARLGLSGDSSQGPQEVALQVDAPPHDFALAPSETLSSEEAPRAIDPGNVEPASFESTPADKPIAPPAQSSPAPTAVGDRYAMPSSYDDPNPFEREPLDSRNAPPPPAPSEPMDSGVQEIVLGAPSYSQEDLAAALADAEHAGGGFAQGSLADAEQVPVMGQQYANLCYLAQVVTLLDPSDPHPERKQTEMLAMDLYKRMFRDEAPRSNATQIAGPWIGWADRPHGGVFFTGTPEAFHKAGSLYEYEFYLGEELVRVVTEEKIDVMRYVLSQSREMGILGVVVEAPQERLAGYEGDAPRVVWCRKTIPLAPILARP